MKQQYPTNISWDNEQLPKAHGCYPKGRGGHKWCKRCRALVLMPCQLCKVRLELRRGTIPEEPEVDDSLEPPPHKSGGRPLAKERVSAIRRLFRSGKPKRVIAIELGVSRQTVETYTAR